MKRAAVLVLLLSPACVAGAPDDPGPSLPELDCRDAEPLEVGRCTDARTGADCTGASDEQPSFTAMTDGASMPLVQGPQGSSMFVVALRATGIDPGDPSEPLGPSSPLVEIVVRDGDEELSLLRRRSAFTASPERPDTFDNAGFFVVIDERCSADRLLTADVALTDARGARRCGALSFEATCGR